MAQTIPRRFEVVTISDDGRVSRGTLPLIEAIATGSDPDAPAMYVFDPDAGTVVWSNPATESLAF